MTSTTPQQQAEEALVTQAAALIDKHHWEIYSQDEVPSSEMIARLLCGRRMLTSPELEDARLDNHLGLMQTLHRTATADLRKATRYITALQRVATVLMNQIDEVSTLAAVAKTRKGQQLVEQGRAARVVYDRASGDFSKRSSSAELAAP